MINVSYVSYESCAYSSVCVIGNQNNPKNAQKSAKQAGHYVPMLCQKLFGVIHLPTRRTLSHLSSPLSENSLVRAQKKTKARAAELSTEAFAIRNSAPSRRAWILFLIQFDWIFMQETIQSSVFDKK